MGPVVVRLAVVAALVTVPAAASGQDVLDLALGDPARSSTSLQPRNDVAIDTHDGSEVTPAEIAARLADVRLLLIGESHTSMEFHAVQARIVRALQAAGRRVLIGLEMFPVTEQPSLDRWNDGSWSEAEFVANAEWYRHWSYNWGYYRDIFAAARAGGSPMYALNAPRANVTAVRQRGFEALSEEERIGLPPTIDVDDAEHLTLFKSYFGDGAADGTHGGMTDDQWQAMFAAQCTWDAAMGWNAVRRLQEDPDPDAIMVVMVGSGHVAYGLGIARQAAAFFDGRIATLIPVPMRDDDDEPVEAVRASYADFVWGVPAEPVSVYPSLGLSLNESPNGGLAVLFADPDSLGGAAGIGAGDRLLTLDGWDLADRPTFHRLVGDKRWGDVVELGVAREDGSGTTRILLPLRRE